MPFAAICLNVKLVLQSDFFLSLLYIMTELLHLRKYARSYLVLLSTAVADQQKKQLFSTPISLGAEGYYCLSGFYTRRCVA